MVVEFINAIAVSLENSPKTIHCEEKLSFLNSFFDRAPRTKIR